MTVSIKYIDFWDILPIYAVSNAGIVYNMDRFITREQHLDKYGYANVVLYTNDHKRKNFKVHRLVAKAFIHTDDDTLQVNHINGIKHDNDYTNLEWCTCSENQIHARKTGLHPYNILSEDDITTLVRMVLLNYSTHDILMYFNVGKKSEDPRFKQFVRRISAIKHHEIYKDVIDKVAKEFNDYPIGK